MINRSIMLGANTENLDEARADINAIYVLEFYGDPYSKMEGNVFEAPEKIFWRFFRGVQVAFISFNSPVSKTSSITQILGTPGTVMRSVISVCSRI
jgi:hypothetical protein